MIPTPTSGRAHDKTGHMPFHRNPCEAEARTIGQAPPLLVLLRSWAWKIHVQLMHTSTLRKQTPYAIGISWYAIWQVDWYLLSPSQRKLDQSIVFKTKFCELRLTPTVVLAGTGGRNVPQNETKPALTDITTSDSAWPRTSTTGKKAERHTYI